MDIETAKEMQGQGNANLVGSASDTLAALILAVEALAVADDGLVQHEEQSGWPELRRATDKALAAWKAL